MTENSEQPRRRFPMSQLRALVDALQNLYLSLAAKLLEKRTQPLSSSSTAGSSVDIADSIRDQIDQTAAESIAGRESRTDTDEPAEAPPATDRATGSGKIGGAVKPGLFTELANRFRRNRKAGKLEPHLWQEMQAKTMAYINKSVRMSKQGKANAAKMYTELAENAMKTASEYMTEEEYRAFEQKVKEKIQSVRKSYQGNPDEPG